MATVGIGTLGFRGRRSSGARLTINEGVAVQDLLYFPVLLALGAAVGIVDSPFPAKPAVAFLLLGAYAFYVLRMLQAEGGPEDVPERLWL